MFARCRVVAALLLAACEPQPEPPTKAAQAGKAGEDLPAAAEPPSKATAESTPKPTTKQPKLPKAPDLVTRTAPAWPKDAEALVALPDLVVPVVDTPTDPLRKGLTVYVSAKVLRFEDEVLSAIDGGRLDPASLRGHLVEPLFDRLTARIGEAKKAAKALDDEWDPRLVIVADESLPYETLVDVMYTAGYAEVRYYDFVVMSSSAEAGVVPVEPPRFAAKVGPSGTMGLFTGADDSPLLTITIDGGGFEARVAPPPQGATPTRIGVRAAKGHDAWDYLAVTEQARAHRRAHESARMVFVAPKGSVPYGVVVRTMAAVRGPECATGGACSLPHVVATAPEPAVTSAPPKTGGDVATILGETKGTALEDLLGAGSTPPSGTLDKAAIRDVVRAHVGETRRCYAKVLLKQPKAAGTVKLRFTIGGKGKVTKAEVVNNELPSTIEACLTGAVEQWAFPAPASGDPTVVNYPFVFKPGT